MDMLQGRYTNNLYIVCDISRCHTYISTQRTSTHSELDSKQTTVQAPYLTHFVPGEIKSQYVKRLVDLLICRVRLSASDRIWNYPEQ